MTNQTSSNKPEKKSPIQDSLEQTASAIFKRPENTSDFIVTGSAFLAALIVVLYVYRIVKKLVRSVSK